MSIAVVALGIVMGSPIPAGFGTTCEQNCRAQYDAGIATCQRQNTSYVQYPLLQACTDQAHEDYRNCLSGCTGGAIGPRRLRSLRREPLPPYAPRPLRER